MRGLQPSASRSWWTIANGSRFGSAAARVERSGIRQAPWPGHNNVEQRPVRCGTARPHGGAVLIVDSTDVDTDGQPPLTTHAAPGRTLPQRRDASADRRPQRGAGQISRLCDNHCVFSFTAETAAARQRRGPMDWRPTRQYLPSDPTKRQSTRGHSMRHSQNKIMSRRGFCLFCIGAATAASGWLTPREAFAEARGIVSLIKDSAAVSPIVTHKLRGNVSILEGSGGNIAVLTGPDGKVLVDAGIGVSRPQITKALAGLGAEPVSHLINSHWHFDHADGNAWLQSSGARIIAHENTRKHLSTIQRVEDWDYNFLPLPAGGIPSEV